jgi:hypothetical protein
MAMITQAKRKKAWKSLYPLRPKKGETGEEQSQGHAHHFL